MSTAQAVLLGLVQGVTEFLPISSSGHLILLQRLFGLEMSEGIAFDVLLHVATLLAVPTLFWRDILNLFGTKREELRMLALGTVPAVIAGGLIKGTRLGSGFEALAGNVFVVGAALVVTGIVLWLAGVSMKKRGSGGGIGAREAVLIGIAQAVAIIPGISRSGTTIAVAIMCGIVLADAVRFSFLLAIPVIAGGALIELKELGAMTYNPGPLIAGFITALVFGIISLRIVAFSVLKRKFPYFAVYCIPLGLIVIIISVVGGVS